jgi:hypothetical protein
MLQETLEEAIAEGHKALVFSQWTGLLDRVEPYLKKGQIELCGWMAARGIAGRWSIAFRPRMGRR